MNSELILKNHKREPVWNNLTAYVKQTINEHRSIKVTKRASEDFIDMSADEWEREQQTLHVLQSNRLMRHIAESVALMEALKALVKFLLHRSFILCPS